MKKSSSAPTERIPQRTCIACRAVRTKREMVRVVHTPEGTVEVDIHGKKAGRGAYLCPTPACWEAGLKGNHLEHALKSKLTPQDKEQLLSYANNLPKEKNSGK